MCSSVSHSTRNISYSKRNKRAPHTARASPVQQESKSDNMSCMHLYLGQAGNQIGKEFWGLAEDEFYVDGGGGGGRPRGARRSARRPPSNTTGVNTMHRLLHPGGAAMFHEDGSARCIAVDSEPKARTRENGYTVATRSWRKPPSHLPPDHPPPFVILVIVRVLPSGVLLVVVFKQIMRHVYVTRTVVYLVCGAPFFCACVRVNSRSPSRGTWSIVASAECATWWLLQVPDELLVMDRFWRSSVRAIDFSSQLASPL